jgi:homocysteine S-methyltransferase
MTPDWVIEPFTVVDGGLSTALEALGHHATGLLWTAQLVVDRPDVIVAAHRTFVDAGADVIISSSYQASVAGFQAAGLDAVSARRALASTTDLARRSGARFVAASIGPFGASLGDGSEYHGRYDASWADVRAFHRARFEVLADTAIDLFAIETVPTLAEAEIVLDELARATSSAAWLSMTCGDERLTCGGDPIEVAAALAASVEQVAAFGVNCTDPRFVSALLRRSASSTAMPLLAYPNHGRAWDAERKCWVGEDGNHLADLASEWLDLGARLLGGCCGVGADGVARLAEVRAGLRGG